MTVIYKEEDKSESFNNYCHDSIASLYYFLHCNELFLVFALQDMILSQA